MQDHGILDGESWQSLAASDVAAIRHWFVESDGSYIGPMEVGEVERLWFASEIDEHTRVWTEGMADWQPLGDVPDLMYLVVERPSPPPPAPPTWEATKAASLSTLVHSEMKSLATGSAAVPSAVPTGLPAIEPFDSRDPFAGWWTAQPAPAQPTPWPNDPWSARAPRTRSRLRWAVAGGGAIVVALVATLLYALAHRGPSAATSRSASAPSLPTSVRTAAPAVAESAPEMPLAPVAPEPAAPAPDAVAASPGPEPAAASAAPAKEAPAAKPASRPLERSAPERAVATPRSEAATAEPESPAERARPASAPAEPRRVARAEPRAATEPLAPAAAPESLVPAEPLTPQEVVAATRAQVRSLAECIKTARSSGEIEARRYTFVLDWHIRADGSVSSASLKGPAEVAGSSLGPCFEAEIRAWRYRASPEDFDVRNFPLPVTVR